MVTPLREFSLGAALCAALAGCGQHRAQTLCPVEAAAAVPVCDVRFIEPGRITRGCGIVADAHTILMTFHEVADVRTGQVVINGHQTGYTVDPCSRPADDVAVLRLDAPLPGSHPAARINLDRPVPPGTPVFVVGYRVADGQAPPWERPIEPLLVHGQVMPVRFTEYTRAIAVQAPADQLGPGLSGSPAVIREGEEWVIVGLLSGSVPGPEKRRIAQIIAR